MKKILLIIAIAFCIFQMVVLALDIDIGSLAIDRDGSYAEKYSIINKENPADGTGKITSVEIWAYEAMTNVYVGTLYVVSGNDLACRSQYHIASVPVGSKQIIPVDLDVEEGDYIGINYESGRIEFDFSGGEGVWYRSGTYGGWIIDEGFTYVSYPGYVASLYGTGETVVAGITWNGVTITKWNGVTITKWNGLE